MVGISIRRRRSLPFCVELLGFALFLLLEQESGSYFYDFGCHAFQVPFHNAAISKKKEQSPFAVIRPSRGWCISPTSTCLSASVLSETSQTRKGDSPYSDPPSEPKAKTQTAKSEAEIETEVEAAAISDEEFNKRKSEVGHRMKFNFQKSRQVLSKRLGEASDRDMKYVVPELMGMWRRLSSAYDITPVETSFQLLERKVKEAYRHAENENVDNLVLGTKDFVTMIRTCSAFMRSCRAELDAGISHNNFVLYANKVNRIAFDTITLMHKAARDLNMDSLIPQDKLLQAVSSSMHFQIQRNVTLLIEYLEWMADISQTTPQAQQHEQEENVDTALVSPYASGVALKASRRLLRSMALYSDPLRWDQRDQVKKKSDEIMRLFDLIIRLAPKSPSGEVSHMVLAVDDYLCATKPFSRLRNEDAAFAVHRLFMHACDNNILTSNDKRRTSEECVGRLCSAAMSKWSYEGSLELGATKCQELLKKWHELQDRGKAQVTKQAYRQCISTWSYSRGVEAVERIESLLEDMTNLLGISPTTEDYNFYLKSLTKKTFDDDEKFEDESAIKAEHCLQMMCESDSTDLRPDIRSFNKVLIALVRSNQTNVLDRAETVICQLLEEQQRHNLMPDSHTFRHMMGIYSKNSLPGKAVQDFAAFVEMMEAKTTDSSFVRLDEATLRSLILATREITDFRELLALVDMLGIAGRQFKAGRLDGKLLTWFFQKVIWNFGSIVMNRGKKSRGAMAQEDKIIRAAREILGIWEYMVNLLSPHGEKYRAEMSTCLNYVVRIWSMTSAKGKFGQGENDAITRVRDIIDKAWGEYKVSKSVKPDVRTHAILLSAIARSSEQDKAQIAYNELKKMEQMAEDGLLEQPSIVAYNTVLSSCCTTGVGAGTSDGPIQEHRQKALAILKAIYHKVATDNDDPKLQPDHVFYVMVFRALGKLYPGASLDTEKMELLEDAFAKCTRNGLVVPTALRAMRDALPREKSVELVGDQVDLFSFISVDNVPASWTEKTKYLRNEWRSFEGLSNDEPLEQEEMMA